MTSEGEGSIRFPIKPEYAGLCAACVHMRAVRSARGSLFVLCKRSKDDPGFPRYPTLPVLGCRGYEPRSPSPGAGEP